MKIQERYPFTTWATVIAEAVFVVANTRFFDEHHFKSGIVLVASTLVGGLVLVMALLIRQWIDMLLNPGKFRRRSTSSDLTPM